MVLAKQPGEIPSNYSFQPRTEQVEDKKNELREVQAVKVYFEHVFSKNSDCRIGSYQF